MSQVVGGGVLLVRVEPVGVDKMRVGKAELCYFCVHEPGEALHTAGNGYGDSRRRVVGRFEQHGIKKVLKGKFFATIKIYRRALDADGSRRYFNNLV